MLPGLAAPARGAALAWPVVVALDERGARLEGGEPMPEAGPALLERPAATVGGRPGSHVVVRRGPGVGLERVNAVRRAARRACVARFDDPAAADEPGE